MEKDRERKTALRDCAGRPAPDGPRRPVGELALAGGREGTQLRDHDDDAERAMRGDPQPDAGGLNSVSFVDDDGPQPTGERYCIMASRSTFVPARLYRTHHGKFDAPSAVRQPAGG